MLEQIKNTIKLTTDIYLEKHFPRIPEDKKQIAINAYEKDIERLANFVYNSWFLNDDFILSEDFIKWFHKSFYPDWFIQKGIDEKWIEIIYFIPWEYKKIKTLSSVRKEYKYYWDVPGWNPEKEIYTIPEKTQEDMEKLINNFNISFINEKEIINKKDILFFFIIDFIYIHPFADWNGRINSILLDLFLVKIWFKAIWFKTISSKNKLLSDRSVYFSYQERNLKYIYDFIENNKT